MLVYRVSKNNPPVGDDMKSHWDLGIPLPRPQDEEAWKEVSTFDTPEAAAEKSRRRGLGPYVVELEVPDAVRFSRNLATGHVGLKDTTPEQLLRYVRRVQPLEDV